MSFGGTLGGIKLKNLINIYFFQLLNKIVCVTQSAHIIKPISEPVLGKLIDSNYLKLEKISKVRYILINSILLEQVA